MGDILIYGAYGYTGELVAERAVAVGLNPILAGRSETKLRPIASRLKLRHRAFPLDNAAALDRGLEGVSIVAHCAGPFRRTSKPMADACLRSGVHYLDLTGEVRVFEDLRARNADALRAGVMLLPGVGMDVLPADCLAVYTSRRVSNPAHLTVAIYAKTRASRGSRLTMLDSIVGNGAVRRGGCLESVPMFWKKREIEFDSRRRVCAIVPTGELVACFHSTGIGDIETYVALPRIAAAFSPLLRALATAVKAGPIREFLERRIESGVPGLTPEERAKGCAIVFAEVEDHNCRVARSKLYLPEPYTFTALAAVLCIQKARMAPKPGFQTPATAFGPDFVLEIDGVRREDAGP